MVLQDSCNLDHNRGIVERSVATSGERLISCMNETYKRPIKEIGRVVLILSDQSRTRASCLGSRASCLGSGASCLGASCLWGELSSIHMNRCIFPIVDLMYGTVPCSMHSVCRFSMDHSQHVLNPRGFILC
jgi:hypothetical protein